MACYGRGYNGPVSDHFDGKYFHNQVATRDKSLIDVLMWRFNRELPDDPFWQVIDRQTTVEVMMGFWPRLSTTRQCWSRSGA